MAQPSQILLAHGSGGRLMHDLIHELFQHHFSNDILDELTDSAVISKLPDGDYDICFTTDSYVVNPLFFPGGDIGKLAVCGTVNDLAVVGAQPLYISCGFIIEEGLDYDTLAKIVESMAEVAKREGIKIVTGDTKVVEKRSADKLFINTSGIGLKPKQLQLGTQYVRPGDKVIINGTIGEHELAILLARGEFEFEAQIQTDCAALTGLIQDVLKVTDKVKFMRDPTRGGLATTLNELVSGMGFGILIHETRIPVRDEVRAICEILGYDPLYLANEGKVVIVVAQEAAEPVLQVMREHPLGKDSQIIGEVVDEPKGKVILRTEIGGHRIIDMLTGVQLPRIC